MKKDRVSSVRKCEYSHLCVFAFVCIRIAMYSLLLQNVTRTCERTFVALCRVCNGKSYRLYNTPSHDMMPLVKSRVRGAASIGADRRFTSR